MKSILIVLVVIFLGHDLRAQDVAPDFVFSTSDGLTTALSDLEGKVVYLSFWASWCGPCKKNFQKYHGLRTQLEAEGVVLLNISLDKDKDKWAAALDKFSYINGTNGHAADLNAVKASYRVSKVPDYHIIDKSGQFVYLSDKPGRDIVAEFREWLK